MCKTIFLTNQFFSFFFSFSTEGCKEIFYHFFDSVTLGQIKNPKLKITKQKTKLRLLHSHQSLWYAVKIGDNKWTQSLLWVKFLWGCEEEKLAAFYHHDVYTNSCLVTWFNIKHQCLCSTCAPGAYRGQKEHWIPWKLSHRWFRAIMWVWGSISNHQAQLVLLTLSHLSSQRNTFLTRFKHVFVLGKNQLSTHHLLPITSNLQMKWRYNFKTRVHNKH